jgi:hypothetical protein
MIRIQMQIQIGIQPKMLDRDQDPSFYGKKFLHRYYIFLLRSA